MLRSLRINASRREGAFMCLAVRGEPCKRLAYTSSETSLCDFIGLSVSGDFRFSAFSYFGERGIVEAVSAFLANSERHSFLRSLERGSVGIRRQPEPFLCEESGRSVRRNGMPMSGLTRKLPGADRGTTRYGRTLVIEGRGTKPSRKTLAGFLINEQGGILRTQKTAFFGTNEACEWKEKPFIYGQFTFGGRTSAVPVLKKITIPFGKRRSGIPDLYSRGRKGETRVMS